MAILKKTEESDSVAALKKELASLKKEIAALKSELKKAPKGRGGADPRVDKLIAALLEIFPGEESRLKV